MMKWISRLILMIMSVLFIPAFASGVNNKCITDFKNHIISSDTAWFDDCGLNDRDIPIILSYLKTHKEITQLYLLNNNIGDQGAILLSQNKSLQLLELRNNLVGKKGAQALAHSAIHMIDLQGNKYNSKHLVEMNHQTFKNKIQKPDEIIILG